MLQPTTAAPIDSQPGCVDLASAAAVASSVPPAGHCFRTGDSNRCRSVYEQVLRVALHATVLDAQKKNKHVSIGRCRMLAINHGVALPPYEALSRVSFVASSTHRPPPTTHDSLPVHQPPPTHRPPPTR